MYDFTILLLRDAYRTSVAATLDILEAAAEIAPQIGEIPPRWRIIHCEHDGKLSCNQSQAELSLAKPEADTSTWIIPGLGSSSIESVL